MNQTVKLTIYLNNKRDNKYNNAILGFLKENMARFVTAGMLFRIYAYVPGMPALERFPAMTVVGEPEQYGVGAIQAYLLNLQLNLLKNVSGRSRRAIQFRDNGEEESTDFDESNSIKDDMRRMLQRRNKKPGQPQTEIPERIEMAPPNRRTPISATPRRDNISSDDDMDDDEDDSGLTAEEITDKRIMANYRRGHGRSGGGVPDNM